MSQSSYSEHEVRLRVLEEVDKNTQSMIKSLEQKLDSYFAMILGLIFTSIIIPVLLHYLRAT